jgi:pimeloyl-ACP methyl ester carboxylesterase
VQTFERSGLVFDVVDSGPPDAPVVVLLHGFPQFANSWSQVASALSDQGYRCLAPDQRGYSSGAMPAGRGAYRMAELVADVLALVDATGVRRVHLVGHDWGAAVSWAFALQHPDRVASLTALSVPHPAAMLHAMTRSRQFLSSWYMYLFQLPYLPERILTGRRGADARGLAWFLRRYGQSDSAIDRDTEAIVDRSAMGTALNWYRAMLLSGSGGGAATTKVEVPTLFVWSDGDGAIRRQTAEACRDWISGPFQFEVLPGISHWIPDEAPDAVVALLTGHLAAHPV